MDKQYINSVLHQELILAMIGAIAVKVKEPVFESQTKNKLSNTEIRSWIVAEVKDAVVDYLLKHDRWSPPHQCHSRQATQGLNGLRLARL